MAFALYYGSLDLTLIANQINRTDYSQAVKNEAARYWDAGFRTYGTTPFAPVSRREGDLTVKETVVNVGGGASGLQGFANMLRAMAAEFPSDSLALYMAELADDIESGTLGANSAAIEPFVAG